MFVQNETVFLVYSHTRFSIFINQMVKKKPGIVSHQAARALSTRHFLQPGWHKRHRPDRKFALSVLDAHNSPRKMTTASPAAGNPPVDIFY